MKDNQKIFQIFGIKYTSHGLFNQESVNYNNFDLTNKPKYGIKSCGMYLKQYLKRNYSFQWVHKKKSKGRKCKKKVFNKNQKNINSKDVF